MRHLSAVIAALALAAPTAAFAAEPKSDPAAGYAVDTSGSTQKLSAGAKGKLVFTIQPRGEWHVDPRTPLRIDLSAPAGLKLDKERLGKKDAVTPAKADAPTFEAPFTAVAAGTHEARAKLDFFVCSATACVKQVREVTVPVTVQ